MRSFSAARKPASRRSAEKVPVKLYDYFRSSAAYRVRIALNLKGLSYDHASVHLTKGEQRAETYVAINPQALVPTLVDDGATLTQSLAIIEYLDERHPQPPLLPAGPAERARVRALALSIACDIHPLNNLRVLKYLTGVLKIGDDAKNAWYRHWIDVGLAALEKQLGSDPATGAYCHGESPTLADICLVPQLANARRMSVPLEAYPILLRIDDNCRGLDAFAQAAPERQPDAA
jgi:maleylpyruvate isomerase